MANVRESLPLTIEILPIPILIISLSVNTMFELAATLGAPVSGMLLTSVGASVSTVSKYNVVVFLMPAYLLPLVS